jgi:hypothetical protein
VSAWGWWEQPAAGAASGLWKYHPAMLGRRGGTKGGAGGADMFVYDVNGDGLPDIITALEGHGYGLAWFEQKKSASGEISFVRHMIMDRDPALSHGVVFSKLHALTIADVDGDGLKDIIIGKNKWAHYGYMDPDGDGDGVVYWF